MRYILDTCNVFGLYVWHKYITKKKKLKTKTRKKINNISIDEGFMINSKLYVFLQNLNTSIKDKS